jgi:hypothetical protein
MGWFRKKEDLLSQRERALSQEISRLETQIKKLDLKVQRNPDASRASVNPFAEATAADHIGLVESEKPEEPIFERVDQQRLKEQQPETIQPEHYNDLGMRKLDLPGLLRRFGQHLRGPATTNPKLVSYLAAGGIQGLRPLRYEKRIARNRLLVSVVFLFLMLLGIILVLVRQR